MTNVLPDNQELNADRDGMKEASRTPSSFEQLERINRASNQAFFLNGFSHVFNNQINSLLLGGEYLQSFVHDVEMYLVMLESDPEKLSIGTREIREKYLSTIPRVVHGISSSARTLNRFVSHLSEFSGNVNTASHRDLDINQLVTLCVSMTDHQIRACTNHFHLELEDGIPTFSGNPQQMLQVILSLLMNALLSLPDRSREVVLSTSCNRDTGRIQLCLRDAGMGISADDLPHITEAFFTTWSKQGCMGLGLTVADRIIRDLAGELTIDSESGRGTNALVSLPVHDGVAVSGTERNHV
jgi:signal transduction histidine kinase